MVEQPIPVEGEFTLLRPKEFGQGLRRSRRYRCGLATLGKISFPRESQTRDAIVQNLSKTGIGLNMLEPLPVGQELLLKVRIPGETAPRQFSMHVIHATQEADRSWRIGCQFSEPLTPDLLELLLQ